MRSFVLLLACGLILTTPILATASEPSFVIAMGPGSSLPSPALIASISGEASLGANVAQQQSIGPFTGMDSGYVGPQAMTKFSGLVWMNKLSIQPLPWPGTLLAMGTGMLGLMRIGMRRKRYARIDSLI